MPRRLARISKVSKHSGLHLTTDGVSAYLESDSSVLPAEKTRAWRLGPPGTPLAKLPERVNHSEEFLR